MPIWFDILSTKELEALEFEVRALGLLYGWLDWNCGDSQTKKGFDKKCRFNWSYTTPNTWKGKLLFQSQGGTKSIDLTNALLIKIEDAMFGHGI